MKQTFLPLKRDKIRRVPWGYVVDQTDPYLLLPIAEQMDALNEAFDMLDRGGSLRKVAAWLSTKTGTELSLTTLKKYYDASPDREEGRKSRSKLVENFVSNNRSRRWSKASPEQKEILEIGRLKTRITKKQKKLEKLRDSQASIKELENLPKKEKEEEPKLTIPAECIPASVQIKIGPHPGPQTEFLAASEKELFYGGAAGGGKSFALLLDPLRTVNMPTHKAIIFRKTNDELRTLVSMSKELYTKIVPGAKFLEQKNTWVFPRGGWHWFRFLDHDKDVEAMQGQDFTWAGFDELPQWSSPFVYEYIASRVRSSDPEIRPYLAIRATGNPGGAGSWWVKKKFMDFAPPNTPFPACDMEGNALRWPDNHERAGQYLHWRRFIPAKLKDNPSLYNDGSYEAGLLSLPEIQRRQLLEGDWDVVEGAAFTEFNRRTHTCAPFDIPSHWVRFRAADWGYNQPGCVLWFACDPNGNLYVYREFYHSRTLTPKTSLAQDVADKILELEQGEHVRYGVMDSSTWNQRGTDDTGPSIAETMIRRGCMWRKSDRHKNSRKFSKMEIHRRLQIRMLPDEITGKIVSKPNLIIFNTCLNLIRTLPVIPTDKNDPEDVDTDSEDHAYDALRYGCMSRPVHNTYRVHRLGSVTPVRQDVQYDSFGFPI